LGSIRSCFSITNISLHKLPVEFLVLCSHLKTFGCRMPSGAVLVADAPYRTHLPFCNYRVSVHCVAALRSTVLSVAHRPHDVVLHNTGNTTETILADRLYVSIPSVATRKATDSRSR
jgi:hypothetical protein